MHQIQLQLNDQLYEEAKRRAAEAGFASLDAYIVEVVAEDLITEAENLDHRFTPKVIAHLDQIRNDIQAGAKTYTTEEVEEHLKQKAKAWRDSHAS